MTATDLGGLAASETFNIVVTTAAHAAEAVAECAGATIQERAQLEVGMKFTSSSAGQITALKFYRSASDTGPNVVDLWSSTGKKPRQRDIHQHRREWLADRDARDASFAQHEQCRIVHNA